VRHGLAVVGSLPRELDGAFMRVGPNPALATRSPLHLFDGDGAVALFRVEKGEASFCWEWVRTEKLLAERAAGRGRVALFGSMRGVYGLFHMVLNLVRQAVDVRNVKDGVANTALVVHAERLLALHEGSMPYGLRVACDGAMETLGRVLFDGECPGPISAHPRVHPGNGAMYSVSYSFDAKVAPAVVRVVEKDGVTTRAVPVDVGSRRSMMHDGQLTERWVVVMDLPLVFRPEAMVKGGKGGGGFPIVFDEGGKSRFGLLPVDATDNSGMVWFEFEEALYIFHTAAAWDEGEDTVVLWACTMDSLTLELNGPGGVSETQLNKFTLNTATGRCARERFPLPNWGVGTAPPQFDFPTTHPSLPGTRRRFTYLVGFEQSSVDTSAPISAGVGVIKFDMEAGCEVARLRFGPRGGEAVHGGEAVFVPRTDAASEDDGYLVTIVNGHPRAGGGGEAWSALVVYDAQSMDAEPVALVRAPRRIPLGFHALFVPLEKLRGLRTSVAWRTENGVDGDFSGC
jgi:carotenoid 9,10(9',10')-cleavage dioxygenase 1